MKTELRTDFTIEDICKGFHYNELEEKGLYGLSGKLTIQPEYQRNYIYNKDGKDAAVIDSVLKGYPLGIIYFNKISDDKYEVLDGQQRITSLGRFAEGKLSILQNGIPQSIGSIAADLKDKFLQTKLLIYISEGTESEIKEWFKTINIAGIPLNTQELLNAVYSGPFVTLAKAEFSNSNNSNAQKWSYYVSGDIKRQQYLETALDWVSSGHISEYMQEKRYCTNINELKACFNEVINWVASVFDFAPYPEMKGLDWGKIYLKYHNNAYDPAKVRQRVQELMEDTQINDRKGIFEYILGGEEDTKLLQVRVFDEKTKRAVYNQQTAKAKAEGVSNCSYCAMGHDSNKAKIWRIQDMDADHVAAWSKGGATSIENCEMLCKPHNRAKGNR